MTAPATTSASDAFRRLAWDDVPEPLERVADAEPVSPELALIDPVLRAQAIASLPGRVGPEPFFRALGVPPEPIRHAVAVRSPQSDARDDKQRSMVLMVPLYLAGSLVTSFVFGVAFIATITAVIVLLNELG
jgi:hypothetical protein